MAGPSPETLRRVVDRFPTPPESDRFAAADDLLDGAYGRMADEWHPELRRLAGSYADGDVLRERVLEHVEAVPSYRLTDGAAPLPDRRAELAAAADTLDEVAAVAEWYADLRALLADDPDELTLFERALHDFGYVVAHVLFLGASSPASVVRRLRLAYRSVGVRIDDTAVEGDRECTTFTCPYRNVGAGRCGKRWVCHEKLDRVDDGYVTYLADRGIDYRRPRGCSGSEQCYSTVARGSPEQWWPKTPPAAVRDAGG
ncbi:MULTISPECIES: hypothetical protein [Halolamina]|uniref:Uncharacterized protein n=1 Tax=Halolamina pelagica TaxID=699431 RepID=A0A1I5Q1Q6_9EURY|nr:MULTISPECIES: hypothetical protein [Halolamina]NHX35044.1 hypothetical protein [Halolamina sp. R1-12]SFP39816.1 hypothetical protein SAMN05216277_103201 [Halolamina pelagica]